MGLQSVVSVDILQEAAAMSGSGNGEVGGSEVNRSSRGALSLEMVLDVTAIDGGVTQGDFILEARLSGGAWYELGRISNVIPAAVGTPPAAFSMAVSRSDGKALGEDVRGRYEIVGGSITGQLRLVRKE